VPNNAINTDAWARRVTQRRLMRGSLGYFIKITPQQELNINRQVTITALINNLNGKPAYSPQFT